MQVSPVDLNVHDKEILNYLKNIDNSIFQKSSDIVEH